MTLCNVILQPTIGFLMSDAGLWDWQGNLTRFIQKVHLFPTARAAVVGRGNSAVEPDWWANEARHVRSLDELLNRLPDVAAKLRTMNQKREDRAIRHHVEITVVFWDEKTDRPRVLQLDTSAIGGAAPDGYAAILDSERKRAPGKWYDFPSLALMPTLTWDASLPDLRHQQDEKRFDVRANAARIVNKQREIKHEIEGHLTTIVAGWVDMAVVTRDGVTMERVIGWPDVPVGT